jgi:hypothetical protein
MSKLTKIRLGVFAFAFLLILFFQWLESGITGLIDSMPYYGILVAGIALILAVQYVWRLIFCQGISLAEGKKFELSGLAEVMLHIANLSFLIGTAYILATSEMSWYEYIVPVLMCLLPVASSFNFYANRKDFIELFPGEARFFDNGQAAAFKFSKHEFYRAESDALSISFSKSNSWHLKLTGPKGTRDFDLKDMNLNGHKHAIERYLKSIGAADRG